MLPQGNINLLKQLLLLVVKAICSGSDTSFAAKERNQIEEVFWVGPMGQRAIAIDNAFERIAATPFDSDQWPEALKFLAAATGSSFAQLAGWTGPNQFPMYITWNEPDRMVEQWLELGGADPTVNPVIRVGMRTPELQTVSDAEIITPTERKKLAIWGDFYEPYGLPHICFTPLWRDHSAHLVLVVLRSGRAGVIGPEERSVFQSIARRCREAVMLAQALKHQGARLLQGTLDALSVSAFAVDGFGRLTACSVKAERLLQEETVLRYKNGRLEAVVERETARLDLAIAPYLAKNERTPSPVSLEIMGSSGTSTTIRISALPRDRIDIGFGSTALIVVEEQPYESLPSSIGVELTTAERDVAFALLNGERAAQIALHRGVSVHTVRAQIKSVYSKLNVSDRVEFLLKLQKHS